MKDVLFDMKLRERYLKLAQITGDYQLMADWENFSRKHGNGSWFNVMIQNETGALCIVQHTLEVGIGSEPVNHHNQVALLKEDAEELRACLNAYLLPDEEPGRSTAEMLEDPEVRQFVDADHTRRGGTQ